MSQLWISQSSVFNSISCGAEQSKRLRVIKDLLFMVAYTIIVGAIAMLF
jgi:hypothetical protein